MALWNNTCPLPGDSDNNLLSKIAQELCEGGGGSGAGVSSISLNGGPPQTGAVSITTGGGGGVTSVNGDPGPAVLLDSGEVPEGLNLYYTQGRFDTAFAGKTTTDLAEGLNLYFTNARAIASTLTGFVAAPGVVSAADSVLSAFEKIVGNAAAAGPFVLKAGDTMSGALLGAVGSAAAPMFSFSTDPDTGIYRPAADTLGFSSGGANALTLTSGLAAFAGTVTSPYVVGTIVETQDLYVLSAGLGVEIRSGGNGILQFNDESLGEIQALVFSPGAINGTSMQFNGGEIHFRDSTDVAFINIAAQDGEFNGVVKAADGTAALPSHTFGSDPDNGMYLPSANTLGFSTAGVLRLSVSSASVLSTVPFLGANGTAAAPTFSFSGDPDNGMYLSAANVLGLSAAGTERVTLSSTLLTTTLPIQQSNSAALGADPTAATTQWAASGEWQYRSSAASEGAGQTNRVHNRAEDVVGSGTNYSLTTSMARVDFGTTDPEVVLPTAGTYLIVGAVQFVSDPGATADQHSVQLRNSTDAVFVTVASTVTLGLNFFAPMSVSTILTVAASKTIQIWAQNSTSARGLAAANGTHIRYVRLY